mmetsp:Transcript_16382/g.39090  ORF Transcript_16382/g.39090 Transcript_16382/m.39090 type:complete len:248 (-) Transcript_16382:286-1029(-)
MPAIILLRASLTSSTPSLRAATHTSSSSGTPVFAFSSFAGAAAALAAAGVTAGADSTSSSSSYALSSMLSVSTSCCTSAMARDIFLSVDPVAPSDAHREKNPLSFCGRSMLIADPKRLRIPPAGVFRAKLRGSVSLVDPPSIGSAASMSSSVMVIITSPSRYSSHASWSSSSIGMAWSPQLSSTPSSDSRIHPRSAMMRFPPELSGSTFFTLVSAVSYCMRGWVSPNPGLERSCCRALSKPFLEQIP